MESENKENSALEDEEIEQNIDIGYVSFTNKRNRLLQSSLLFSSSLSENDESSTSQLFNKWITPAAKSLTDSGIRETSALGLSVSKATGINSPQENNSGVLSRPCKKKARHRLRNCEETATEKPPSKKRLLFSLPDVPSSLNSVRHQYYNGYECLDIIGKLQPYSLVLNKILYLLDDETLYRMTLVSSVWRDTITSNRQTNQRVKAFIKDRQCSKENWNVKEFPKSSSKGSEVLAFINKNIPQTTQKLSSTINTISQESSLKLIHSMNTEKMMKCPRCSRSARIYDKNSLQETKSTLLLSYLNSNNNNESVDQKTNAFSFSKTHAHLGSPPREIFRNHDDTQIENNSYNYGLCNGISCQFKFCLKCLCKYHSGEKCPLSKLGTPSKVNLFNNCASRQNSQKNSILKSKKKHSLKRLCF